MESQAQVPDMERLQKPYTTPLQSANTSQQGKARGGKVKFARGGDVKPAPFAEDLPDAGMGSGSGTKQLTHIQKKIRHKG
jgi:hypothetical protein